MKAAFVYFLEKYVENCLLSFNLGEKRAFGPPCFINSPTEDNSRAGRTHNIGGVTLTDCLLNRREEYCCENKQSRNIFSSKQILPTILNCPVGLFGNILYVSCRHCQINVTKKSLNCKWIS